MITIFFYYVVIIFHFQGPRLRLDKISRLNMGDYLCVASNGIPPSASNRFSIRVQCELAVNKNQTTYLKLIDGVD